MSPEPHSITAPARIGLLLFAIASQREASTLFTSNSSTRPPLPALRPNRRAGITRVSFTTTSEPAAHSSGKSRTAACRKRSPTTSRRAPARSASGWRAISASGNG